METLTRTLGQIAGMVGAQRPSRPSMPISRLLIDSRSLLSPATTLFVALATASGDGALYIRSLYERGVRAFMVNALPEEAPEMKEAEFLVVADTREALCRIGRACREGLKGKVVAVTGSRGKTIVKEWAARLFEACGRTVSCSPRSFNSRIGVPLSLWRANPDADFHLIEAGISRRGEMAPLARMIAPDTVVLTSLTSEHDSGFASRSEKLAEKLLLSRDASELVAPADIPGLSTLLSEGVEVFGWSASQDDAFLKVTDITPGAESTVISFTCRGESHRIVTPLQSRPLIDDLLTAVTLALAEGLPADVVVKAAGRLRRLDTRLQVVDAQGESRLVIDRFAVTAEAADQALDFAARGLTQDEQLVLITPPVEGLERVVEGRGVSRLILVGEGADVKVDAAIVERHPDVAALLSSGSLDRLDRSMIVVMEASSPSFSRISEALEAKRHETVLEVNLDAVVDNLNFFRSKLRPTTGVCCMIKASGYGAGSVELARTLQSHGATYLAVAVHDEGVELRQSGITMPVIVLNPRVDSLNTIFANALEPEIYSLDFLRRLIEAAEREGFREFPVHIKIDSGMHRLGFLKDTLPEVIELLRSTDAVVPRSIFSHLACADDPAEDAYTRSQFDYFAACCRMLCEAFPGRKILRHILNSTGIIRFPEEQLDMVRLGIGLYGLRTLTDGSMDALRPVSALYASIISIKEWPAGTTIGYNRRGLLTRPSRIAVVPIGYADGLNRRLSRGAGAMIVRGCVCPIVGNICMDACMIDVTDVPDAAVGDRVEVFGPHRSVDTLADTLDTISYEIVAGLSPRIKRVYFRE